ncbi:MAG: helix-turn-helix domain-containing protein [Clostridia bacterium]|nr:helix-turn-helix domain-containing protein [Clostridia bacterium]
MKLNLNENIRMHRRNLDWTQEQLAERLGVSFQSVSRWENGTSMPDIELIVTMAGIFGCTVDELLGVAEPAKKLTKKELREKMMDLVGREDIPELTGFLRMLRYEYLSEYRFLYHLLTPARMEVFGQSQMFMEELRALTKDGMARAEHDYEKTGMLRILIALEDEEHLPGLLDTCEMPESADRSRVNLLAYRANMRWDSDSLRILQEIAKVTRLREFFSQYYVFVGDRELWREGRYREMEDALPPSDPAYLCELSRRKLGMIHLFSGMTPDDAHPVSGDGLLDLWAGQRLEIGFSYAAQLAGTGQTELALTVLEDCVSLCEQAADFPDGVEMFNTGFWPDNCPSVRCTSPELTHIRAYRSAAAVPTTKELRLETVLIHAKSDDVNADTVCGAVMMGNHYRMLTDALPPRDDFRTSWLDAIREDGRFVKLAERMRAIRIWTR